MSVYYSDDLVTLHHGDCIEVMRQLPENSVDSVVTDPPYGLAFMGKDWDDAKRMVGQMAEGHEKRGALAYGGSHDRGYADHDANGFQVFSQAWAAEALRVLKPGGHLLAFGGTRTWHRLAVAIEDAGFEIRDSCMWVYGSGFPKSLDVSKAIDKAAGAKREVLGRVSGGGRMGGNDYSSGDYNGGWHGVDITAPATPAAQQWQGWGTALKPAFEPIVVARKPLDGTVAENVLRWGTGALNIDGSRIRTTDNLNGGGYSGEARNAEGASSYAIKRGGLGEFVQPAGRWPANVILDESQAAELDRQSGVLHSQDPATRASKSKAQGVTAMGTGRSVEYADKGGASRFFYVPKAGASERPRDGDTAHPTVKPLDLMRYLVKLVTPPGGTVLEPFAGSGTTLEACVIEGFHVVGIELTEDYLPLIVQRVTKPTQQVLL